MANFTVKEVLDKAIEKENESQKLYRDLSRKTTKPTVKDAFLELSDEEKYHQNLLEQYLRGELKGTLDIGLAVDYKIVEHLGQPKIAPDMEVKDVFLLAANREKSSYEFYLALAGIHPRGEVKTLLNELAAQELGHKERVEFLYTEVAFPQTDGG